MSDVVLVAVLSALPGIIAAIGALILGLRNRGLIKETHALVNGQSESLRSVIAEAARSQGELAGRDFERRRSVRPEDGPEGP